MSYRRRRGGRVVTVQRPRRRPSSHRLWRTCFTCQLTKAGDVWLWWSCCSSLL